jgi:predicted amidohydrolase
MSTLTLALAQYPIGQFAHISAWRDKVSAWVAQAVKAGAQLLLFPEYGAMELISLLSQDLQSSLNRQISALQAFLPEFIAVYSSLARQHNIYLVAPSIPVLSNGVFRNRAYVFTPAGKQAFQEKRQMTRFENEQWIISAGETFTVFVTDWGKFALAICYDIEFPLIAHTYAMAGADLILVPSCTDTLAGHNRVHIGARARALENQIFVATSSTVGTAEWSAAVDNNVGYAALYTIPDSGAACIGAACIGAPDDGILLHGILNEAGWVYATLDFTDLITLREQGQVFTRRDWHSQLMQPLQINTLNL